MIARGVPSSKRSLNRPTTLKGLCNLLRREHLRHHVVGSLLFAPGQGVQTFVILFGAGLVRGLLQSEQLDKALTERCLVFE